MPLSSRLAARLATLPPEELANLCAAALLEASPATRADAERCLALHTPVPEWAQTEILLSADLMPCVMASVEREGHAAARACSVWRRAWTATNHRRPWLRGATVVEMDFPCREINSLTMLGDT